MRLLRWLFGSGTDNRDRRKEEAERKISVAMPMAGAGAELAGEHARSETEEELHKAAGEKPTQ